ncbi:MAG: FAD-dependent oxidoreductase [Actinomycetota bacterium]
MAFPPLGFPPPAGTVRLSVVIDVEVVGAGFAGLACARASAARGLHTIVWERKRDPGTGVRTTGLLVKETADEEDPPLELVRRIHGVRLYGPSMHWFDLDAPGYYFLATDTPALLRTMADRAEAAGAEIRCDRSFDAPMRTGRVLVGADGPRSRVARAAGLGVNRRFLAGIEAELHGVVDLEERLHVFLDSELAPGYIGWVVPGVGVTQVGLACRAPVRPDLDRFIERVGAVIDLSGSRRIGTRGGLIPVGGTVRRFATRDTVLVGDAAGLVSPLTAGGIHTALRSGRTAGLAIASHLLDDGPPPDRALHRAYPTFAWKRPMRLAMDLPPPNPLIDAALESPRFRAIAQAIFFHHRGLLSGDAWRDLGPAVVSASTVRTGSGGR